MTENNNGIFLRNPNWRVYVIGRTAKMAVKALLDEKDVSALRLSGLIKSLIYQLAQLVIALSYCGFDWLKLACDSAVRRFIQSPAKYILEGCALILRQLRRLFCVSTGEVDTRCQRAMSTDRVENYYRIYCYIGDK